MEKADFSNYRALALEVRHLRALVAELERAGGAASRKARAVDLPALYRAKVEEKAEALLAIETAIDALEAPAERLLMRLRYIEGRSWASICWEICPLGYSERQVYYLHGRALEKLKGV